MFVDSLIASQNVDQKLLSSISQEFQVSDKKGSDIIHSTSELLSNMTHLAGVVMVPKRNSETIRQIEFVPLSGTRVLTVIVTSAGEILNRLIETSREFTRSELEQFSKIVTQQYANTHLEGVRTRVFEQMQADRQHMDKLMADALSMAEQAFGSSDDMPADMIVSGQTNLMDFDELAQMDRLRGLFNAFTEKQEILHLLDRALDADGLQIFIGEESGYTTLRDCSVITAPYEVDNEVIGVLGVIGPTRINYDRVIPIVDITAKLFGAALKTR
jgi:heat-inducible transcriptional repressor